eukprot:INCI4819.1.p1 GENE.INCI4819.1~~INCI4819.1.p1  ORF type:complete len:984 (-),score=149.15 INCI4819.1:701-3652(-)
MLNYSTGDSGGVSVATCVYIAGLEHDLGCLDIRIVATVGACVGLLVVAIVVITVLACRRRQQRHGGSVAPVAARSVPLHRLRAAGRMVIAANKWLQFGLRIAKAATRRPMKSALSSRGQARNIGSLATVKTRTELQALARNAQHSVGSDGAATKAAAELLLKANDMWFAGQATTAIATTLIEIKGLQTRTDVETGYVKSPVFLRLAAAIARDMYLAHVLAEHSAPDKAEIFRRHKDLFAAALDELDMVTMLEEAMGAAQSAQEAEAQAELDGEERSKAVRKRKPTVFPQFEFLDPQLLVLRNAPDSQVAHSVKARVTLSRGFVAVPSVRRFVPIPVMVTEVQCTPTGNYINDTDDEETKASAKSDSAESVPLGSGPIVRLGEAKSSVHLNDSDDGKGDTRNLSRQSSTPPRRQGLQRGVTIRLNGAVAPLHPTDPLANLKHLRRRFHSHAHVLRIFAFHTRATASGHAIVRTLAAERFDFTLDKMPLSFQHLISRRAATHHLLLAHLSRHLVAGLQFIHRKRLLHMHVAPSNVVICREPRHLQVGHADPWGDPIRSAASTDVDKEDKSLLLEVTLKLRLAELSAHVDTALTKKHLKRVALMGEEAQAVYAPDLQDLFHPDVRIVLSGGAQTKRRLVANDVFGCGCVMAFLACGRKHLFGVKGATIPENITAGRSLDLTHFIRDKAFRRIVAHMTHADPHLRWTLVDVVSKSGIFQFRGNCQLGFAPSLGGHPRASGAATWETDAMVNAVNAAERAFEEPPDDFTLEQVSCRDHLSFLRLMPLSHVRQLQLLSTIDERVSLVMETVKLTSGTSGEQASDARLRMMSTDEICALVAFMLDPGRDEATSCVFLRANKLLHSIATKRQDSHAHLGTNSSQRNLQSLEERRHAWKALADSERHAIRQKAVEAAAWAGFLHHLSKGLRNLPKHRGVVYVGAAKECKLKHFSPGQVLHWHTFQCASTSPESAKVCSWPVRTVLWWQRLGN